MDTLSGLIDRSRPPEPWVEAEKIPWNEPGFSRRMLREHLSQAHDAASRRTEIVDAQVAWLHEQVLAGRPSRVLDLGCGPGLYTERLAKLGHSCEGIDFSPASIEYARERARRENADCRYREEDLRSADFGSEFDLVLLLFGEFNAFTPADAAQIARKARGSLRGGGHLLLEAHTPEAVHETGARPAFWYTAERGLFGDEPHLVLRESFWDADATAASQRYFVIDAASGAVAHYGGSLQAYDPEEYRALLDDAGFGNVELLPGLAEPQPGLCVLLAQTRDA